MTRSTTDKQGIFLVLDGADGCGKSTQAERLASRLRTAGHTVVHTREPGGTDLGERIRDLLLDPSLGEVAAMAEVFLYQASRAQLVEAVIRPARNRDDDPPAVALSDPGNRAVDEVPAAADLVLCGDAARDEQDDDRGPDNHRGSFTNYLRSSIQK